MGKLDQLEKLEKSANQSAEWRGHRMSTFVPTWTQNDADRGYFSATSMCMGCGMEMEVRTHPAPNQVDVSGEAVALNCTELTKDRPLYENPEFPGVKVGKMDDGTFQFSDDGEPFSNWRGYKTLAAAIEAANTYSETGEAPESPDTY